MASKIIQPLIFLQTHSQEGSRDERILERGILEEHQPKGTLLWVF
ncbi:MAG: hypothetical protein PUP90_30135 [Nostoc sp. S4]|nr:hypothetical protein [Nostoc sp. S4]